MYYIHLHVLISSLAVQWDPMSSNHHQSLRCCGSVLSIAFEMTEFGLVIRETTAHHNVLDTLVC